MRTAVRLETASAPACDLEAAVSAFLAYCRSKNLSPETLGYYTRRLQSFARYLGDSGDRLSPADVTPQTIREFLACEKDTYTPQTANHSLCALKVFFGFLAAEGFTESNPCDSVQKLKVQKRVVETFTPEQIERILATCRRDFYGVRDRAILLTLLDCGLRASELCGIKLADVDWNEQGFRVLGKGGRERLVPFGQGVRHALAAYLPARTEGLETEALFVSHFGVPLNRCTLRQIVRKRCRVGGVAGVRLSPHTFRHTCAVSYLRAGGDTFTLQKLLGHASQEMTRRYCESLNAEDVQAKHRQFSPVDNMELGLRSTGRKRLR